MIGKRTKWIVVGIGVIAIMAYAAYEARSVIAGPALTIEKPRDGEVFSEPLIVIAGRAKNTAQLSINGRQIFTDEKGNFSDALLLGRGHTIIEFWAEDKFGKVRVKHREVVLK